MNSMDFIVLGIERLPPLTGPYRSAAQLQTCALRQAHGHLLAGGAKSPGLSPWPPEEGGAPRNHEVLGFLWDL